MSETTRNYVTMAKCQQCGAIAPTETRGWLMVTAAVTVDSGPTAERFCDLVCGADCAIKLFSAAVSEAQNEAREPAPA